MNECVQEVRLRSQPADGQPGCTYYMTLLQSGSVQRQIHVGDFVYVAPADMLLPPDDSWMKHIDVLSVHCVERLFTDARFIMPQLNLT